MEKAINLEEFEKVKAFIAKTKETISKYLKDVKDSLSKMSPNEYVESVCYGDITQGSGFECNEIENKNYFDEVNREKEIVISDYDSKCLKATYQRLLKDKDPLVLVCIPEGSEFIKFAVVCPFAGIEMCKLKNFRWVKGSDRKVEKDWKRDYDL